ncbi:hypothetical protein [Erythrobacter colymbi]|uniref:hypothetical protein n=1 Tax=Erythrobacter colymbi TaxID=1161202 RepID=UPI000A367C34|nr:hypothetical protein [Erythrobacter colymbi]
MTNPRFDHVFDAAERIVEEAISAMENDGELVRIFFPGGPADPIRLRARGEWTDLVLADGSVINLHTRAIVGWQLLEQPSED